MKRLFTGALLWLALAGAALAQSSPPGQFYPNDGNLLQNRALICDQVDRTQCLAVDTDGSIPVSQRPCYPVHYLSAANTNPKWHHGPGELCGALVITNSGSTTGGYLRFYDTAGQPTCSSATGVVWGIAVPVNSTAANVAGIVVDLPAGLKFRHGIATCLTGAIADNDTTNFATGAQVNFGVR